MNDDDWEQEELDELDEWDEPAKSPRGMGRLAAVFRPSDDLLAAFFLPVVILILIFAYRGIFPFGQESFLRTDMYHQYAPFFSEFRHKLLSGESLLYSWDVGMGVNFAALYAYYLASPFNWLLLLCPSSLIIEFMTYMIVFKSGLAGLSMAWYLKKHTGSQKFGACYFGVFYALSGYMAAYSWNIMWLDCIVLLPLILHGLERLVREKKRAFLLPDAGTFNPVQLLYINYDMPLHGDLLCGAPVSGDGRDGKIVCTAFSCLVCIRFWRVRWRLRCFFRRLRRCRVRRLAILIFRPHWKSTSRSLT